MSLQDPKTALSNENITPLVSSGPYSLGGEKPKDTTIKFRKESSKSEGAESSKLKVYDTAGESKIQDTPSSRRRLQGRRLEAYNEDKQQNVNFKFDFTVKKFEEELFTFSDCVAELGGAACIIFIILVLIWWLIGIGSTYSFFNNFVDMIGRKYQEASEWKQI